MRAVIIDGNNQLYAAYYAYDGLAFRGKSTSAIYGMPSMLRSTLKDLQPHRTFIVWDGHDDNKKFRKSILPTYKSGREDSLVDIEDLIRQKKILQMAFTYLGIPQILDPKMEGDDEVYFLFKTLRKKYSSIILVSNDKDFHQLVNDQVKVYSGKRILTASDIRSKFGYTPEETIDYLSLLGDNSDQIPGLKGCGKKTIRALLDKYASISKFIDSGDDFPRVNREELLEVYEKNRRLISLEYFYSQITKKRKKPLKFIAGRRPDFNEVGFKNLGIQFGIKSFMDPNFIKPFKRIWRN